MKQTPSDTELVRACRQGDDAAFDALLLRYQRAIFNAAFRMVNNSEDARDIAQNTFLKAYQKLASFDPRYKFPSWLYRIAVNESINLLNKTSRIEPTDREWESGERGPEETFAGVEVSRQVQAALMRIKAEHRTVIVLRHFLHCSYQEISQIVQVPEKTVKSRLFSARQQLKELLSSEGLLR